METNGSGRRLTAIAERGARLMAEVGLSGCLGVEVIVTGFGGAFIAEGIAAMLDLPLVRAYNVPLTRRRLSAERLAHALDVAVHDRVMAAHASALGTKVRAEDGVGRAVAAIARIVRSSPPAATA